MKKNVFKKAAAVILAFAMIIAALPSAFAADSSSVTFTGVDTMMIYNPLIPYENDDWEMVSVTMFTGKMNGQIKTSSGNFNALRANTNGPTYYFDNPNINRSEMDELRQNAHIQKSSLYLQAATSYSVGDTQTFFYWPKADYSYNYDKAMFTCLYAGERCYVWGYSRDFSNKTIAGKMGEAFDNKIYEADCSTFGSARYLKDGDKLNILIYDMNSPGLCGFFWGTELYSTDDIGSYYSTKYNLGKAIIHINSDICNEYEYDSVGLVTIAHEFQHLICFSSSLLGYGEGYADIGTWLNEAMSMQAEENCYPGEVAKQGYISSSYNYSTDISLGQSLYDFSTINDIGVYGQVFLFSEYLKQQYGGKGVFKDIHDYWRTAGYSGLNDASLLSSVLPDSYYSAIDRMVNYPASLQKKIGTKDEITLSKLNLAFQIATVLKEDSGIYSLTPTCSGANPKLYTDTSCDIDDGGRIFVRTKDGNSYTVPSGADEGLIYVGFKNGKMTVAPTTASESAANADFYLNSVAYYDGGTLPTEILEDGIGLSIFKDDSAAVPYTSASTNINYTKANGNWTASTSVSLSEENAYVFGYAPYSSSAYSIKSIPLEASLNGSDYYWAEPVSGVNNARPYADLTMHPALSHLRVSINLEDYCGDACLTDFSVSGSLIAKSGTLNACTGSVTADSGGIATADDPLEFDSPALYKSDSGDIEFDVYVVPVNESGSKTCKTAVSYVMDGVEYTANLSVVIESGVCSDIELTPTLEAGMYAPEISGGKVSVVFSADSPTDAKFIAVFYGDDEKLLRVAVLNCSGATTGVYKIAVGAVPNSYDSLVVMAVSPDYVPIYPSVAVT